MYLDYFIKYQLNPLLDARNLSDEKIKEQQREKELAEKIAKQELEKAKIIEESREYDAHSPQDRIK